MAGNKRDYYEILGVAKSASDADLKKAYRSLAKKYHPDMNPGDKTAEEKFKEVNEAYEVLSDSEKRQQYDQFGHSAFSQGGPGGGGGSGFSGFDFGGFDFGGSSGGSSSGFGGFEDLFSTFFGGGSRGGGNSSRKGEDVGVRVTLTFEEAVLGCKKEINYQRTEGCGECGGSGAEKNSKSETCHKCRGTGRISVQQQTFMGMMQTQRGCDACGGRGKIITNPCRKCRGSGHVQVNKKLEVNIPKGIDHGQRVVLRGQGHAGKNGGPNGDLFVEVRVKSHSFFERDGNHLYCEVPISIAEATLGGDIQIPTLEGKETFRIPEGTQPGTSFTLRGRGVPDVNTGRRGDLIITVNVEIPKNLSAEQKRLMGEFGASFGDQNNAKKTSFLRKLFDRYKN